MSSLLSPIETPRLILRCVEPSDAITVARLMTPSVSRWLASWPSPTTIEFATTRIHEAREAVIRNEAAHYFIERNGDGIGWVRIEREPRKSEIGDLSYWLGEQFQGNGYMVEAAREAVRAAFTLLDLDAIEAGAQTENTSSFQIMRRLGMTRSEERMVFASSRNREELCVFYRLTPAGRHQDGD